MEYSGHECEGGRDMRRTAQIDLFIDKYGIDAAFAMLSKLGYQYAAYELNEVKAEPSFADWSEEEMKTRFEAIGEAAIRHGIEITYVTLSKGIYNDLLPSTFETRKKWCTQAVKAAAYMGSKVVAIQPVFFYSRKKDIYELSKQLTEEVLAEMKPVAEERGVQLGFMNNLQKNAYGTKGEELLELAGNYDAKILIDPSFAKRAEEDISGLLRTVGKETFAFFVTDIERITTSPYGVTFTPLMGQLDYSQLREDMKYLADDTCLTAMNSQVIVRYGELAKDQDFVFALSEYLHKVLVVLEKKGEEAE